MRAAVNAGRRGPARQCPGLATQEGGAGSEAHEARWAQVFDSDPALQEGTETSSPFTHHVGACGCRGRRKCSWHPHHLSCWREPGCQCTAPSPLTTDLCPRLEAEVASWTCGWTYWPVSFTKTQCQSKRGKAAVPSGTQVGNSCPFPRDSSALLASGGSRALESRLSLTWEQTLGSWIRSQALGL